MRRRKFIAFVRTGRHELLALARGRARNSEWRCVVMALPES